MTMLELNNEEAQIVALRVNEGKKRILEAKQYASEPLKDALEEELFLHERILKKLSCEINLD